MRTCEVYELAASCYVDGETTAIERAEMFTHLASCDSCSAFLGDLIQIRADAAGGKNVGMAEKPNLKAAFAKVKEMPRFLADAVPVPTESSAKRTRAAIRTFVLALLVVVIACAVFSTTISVNPQIGPASESPQQLDAYPNVR